MTGILDSIGLSLLLPLLEGLTENMDFLNGKSNLFVIDALAYVGAEVNLTNILIFLISAISAKSIIFYINSVYNVYTLQFFIKQLRIESVDVLNGMSFKHFAGVRAGELQNVLSSEVGRVVGAFTEYSKIIQNAFMALTYFIIALWLDPRFAVLIALGGFILFIIFNGLLNATKKLSSRLVKGNDNYLNLIMENIEIKIKTIINDEY